MDESPLQPAETFARYLARYLITREGLFPGAAMPEAQSLEQAFDIVLTQDDGMLRLVCILDRDADPNRPLAVGAEDLQRIGEECLKYAGRAGLFIDVLVIGAGKALAGDPARLRPAKGGAFGKLRISLWQIDTAAGNVRTDARFGGYGLGMLTYRRLLRRPRLSDAALQPMPPPAALPPRPPAATHAVLGLIALVFLLQHIFAADPSVGTLGLTTRSLMAQGALNDRAVLELGEWYRLLTAALLHGNLVHLGLNAFCLYIVGRVLEAMVGRAWFCALFVLGALGGAAGSMLLNGPGTVSVGASGAIMCLCAATYFLGYRQPPGWLRKRAQIGSLQILVPALLPLIPSSGGLNIDYAGHLGGAIVGAAAGWGLLRVWPTDRPVPPYPYLTSLVPLAAMVAVVIALVPITRAHQGLALRAELIPRAEIPTNEAERRQHAAAQAERYPRDPRAQLGQATVLLEAGDAAGAETRLRRALDDKEMLGLFSAELEWHLRGLLALVLADRNALGEAQEVARPVCRGGPEGPMRKVLAERGLCD